MIREEILLMKGQLAELKKEYERLDIEGSMLIRNLRRELLLSEEDKTKMRIQEISISTDRLIVIQAELASVKEKIRKLKEELCL